MVRSGLILMVLASIRAIAPPAPSGTTIPPPIAPELVMPVAGARIEMLHSEFDDWRGGHRHRALDILAPRGTPVLAAVGGTIRKLWTSKAGGLTIYEFDAAESKVYYYAHLDRYASGLAEHQTVRRGEVLGYVGSTGNASEGAPHLHFAIARLGTDRAWWKGDPINPYPILTK